MNQITVLSHAKVNIGLQIRNKRQDGYHNIHTVFQELDLYDKVTISKNPNACEIKVNKADVPSGKENTCHIAFTELSKFYPEIDGITVEIEKSIPSGGGLGGGSSNAATTLKAINKLYDLQIESKKLENIASNIGADIPFFIRGGTQIGDGIGDVLTPINQAIDGYYLLVLPDISIRTDWAYQSYKKFLEEDLDRPNFAHFLEKNNLSQTIFDNDFERIVIPTYPEIGMLKNKLIEEGADYASLSGSGSTVFGIFSDESQAEKVQLKFRKQYRTFLTRPTNI
jgi:4-diphosphocytidyl-2-C-methyl-D-erythritol kinase